MAEVLVLPLQDFGRKKMLGTISPTLAEEMDENLHRGGKSILFLNQRGFARSVLCTQCGGRVQCEHCDVSLTYHLPRLASGEAFEFARERIRPLTLNGSVMGLPFKLDRLFSGMDLPS